MRLSQLAAAVEGARQDSPGIDPDVALYIAGKRYEIHDLLWWPAGDCFIVRRTSSAAEDFAEGFQTGLVHRARQAKALYQAARDKLPLPPRSLGNVLDLTAEAVTWQTLAEAIDALDALDAMPPAATS